MNKKEKFIIQGLAGQKTLEGSVRINGAKNSALKAMSASILFAGDVILQNIPNTEDIHTIKDILIDLGATVAWINDDPKSTSLKINTDKINKTDVDPTLAGTMRASVVLTGPMLARFGKVSFPAPGGCVIGARPIDLFIEGYKKMGATVNLVNGIYQIETRDGLKGTEILFGKISVGGTETLMMAGTLAYGKTVLRNCAKEPEIGNVAEWLNLCGAQISGIGTDTIIIEGSGQKLFEPKAKYTAIPDRIEAGSYLILGALTAKELRIEDCRPDHLDIVIDTLKKSGVDISIEEFQDQNKTIVVKNDVGSSPVADMADGISNQAFGAFNVVTKEYPGFPTDLQPPIVVFLTQSEGESAVAETIFEGRFKYIRDLNDIGAEISMIDNNQILVKGPTPFHGHSDSNEFSAHDIRAGFAVVLACLMSKGQFTITNVHLIDRGYESLEKKLSALGANIKRV